MSGADWRPVPHFPDYQVNDLGDVRRSMPSTKARVGRILKPLDNGHGYQQVGLFRGGKVHKVYVHRIVAEAFLGAPGDAEVNHRDGCKARNWVANLEWVEHAENQRHAAVNGLMARGTRNARARLTEEGVRAIRARHAAGETQTSIARSVGVSLACVNDVIRGKRWGWVS